MADRNRKSVSCMVRCWRHVEPEHGLDHALHLLLVGAAPTAYGLLDGRGRVLGRRDTALRAGREQSTPRLADAQSDTSVSADVGLL